VNDDRGFCRSWGNVRYGTGYVEGRLADVAIWNRAPTTYELLVAARVDLDALSAASELPLQVSASVFRTIHSSLRFDFRTWREKHSGNHAEN
jgi:hypothetical protein